jgi:hypothetical protein
MLLRAVYPRIADGIDRADTEAWTGLRPVSCDGKPFIGSTRIKGLYVNAGMATDYRRGIGPKIDRLSDFRKLDRSGT